MPPSEVAVTKSRRVSSWSTRVVEAAAFGDVRVMEVDANEPYAANGLLVGSRLIYPTSFPRTQRRLRQRHRCRRRRRVGVQKAKRGYLLQRWSSTGSDAAKGLLRLK